MSIDSEQYTLPALPENGRNTERGKLSSTIERGIQEEIIRLNQFYIKTGISFSQAKDMPGMIEASKSGRGVCRFYGHVAEQNGRVTVTYHIISMSLERMGLFSR